MTVTAFQPTRLFNKINQKQLILCISKKSSIPQCADTILLERNYDDAALTNDMIGPPHPVSNLRPVVWYRTASETWMTQKLRDFQEETQRWNQRFWEIHNTNFVQERKAYVEKHLSKMDDKSLALTADEMSGFYKEFLDKNWKNHTKYNFQWYKKNFTILYLSIAVHLEQLFSRS